jgi:hypothetical protein
VTVKTHPLIREIQLGRSIESLCGDFIEEMNFQRMDELELVDAVKELIRLNDPKVRFAVFVEEDDCYVSLLNKNKEWPERLEFKYWDDEYRFALSDDAELDCENLNEIVRRLFGYEQKPAKKMTNRDFLKKKGECCPYCSRTKIVVLDDVTFRDEKTMGCSKCGQVWSVKYEMKIKGYY